MGTQLWPFDVRIRGLIILQKNKNVYYFIISNEKCKLCSLSQTFFYLIHKRDARRKIAERKKKKGMRARLTWRQLLKQRSIKQSKILKSSFLCPKSWPNFQLFGAEQIERA